MKMADQTLYELKKAHPDYHRLEERNHSRIRPQHEFLKGRAIGYSHGFGNVHRFVFQDRSRLEVMALINSNAFSSRIWFLG